MTKEVCGSVDGVSGARRTVSPKRAQLTAASHTLVRLRVSLACERPHDARRHDLGHRTSRQKRCRVHMTTSSSTTSSTTTTNENAGTASKGCLPHELDCMNLVLMRKNGPNNHIHFIKRLLVLALAHAHISMDREVMSSLRPTLFPFPHRAMITVGREHHQMSNRWVCSGKSGGTWTAS